MQNLIWIAGGSGLVGSALLRRFNKEYHLTTIAPTRRELDLFDSGAVRQFVADAKPDTVILAAAKVGGIAANISNPVSFLRENLLIQDNVMTAAVEGGIKTIMFLGSSCIYPRACPQPMREEHFMTGSLEPTNESYAIAKIAGIRLANALAEELGIRVILPLPCNVYGPGDHYDPLNSHVLSALVSKFEKAKQEGDHLVTLWGTGSARREFIHCDDLADACLFLIEHEQDLGLINVGTGLDQSISELAALVSERVGFAGEIRWDSTKPDGMPRKVLDVSRLLNAGWSARISLPEGIDSVIADFRSRFPLGTE